MADQQKTTETTRKRVRPQNFTQQVSEMGKLPPQATDLEEAVLGAIMLEKDALTNVIDVLRPEAFYKESHQKVFTCIRNIFERSEPVDILTVTQELKKTGELEIVGGAYWVAQLTDRVASSANAEYHARIILEKHIQRELIRISAETIKNAYEDTADAFDLLEEAESGLFQISEGNIRKNYDEMSTLIRKAITEIEHASQNTSGLTGVPSGYTALDRLTSGWQKSDLMILAARPGMGKTAFVINIARNAAIDFKRPVAVFTLEMSAIQLVNRLISSEAEISSEKLRQGNLEPHEYKQLHSRITELAEAPIYIDDTPALSIFELRAKARRLKQEKDIQMIVIDYLQLMTAGGDNKNGNREQEISTISRSLKSIAKELNVPILALSQLSRAVETRGGTKKPQLSDLRECLSTETSFIYSKNGVIKNSDSQLNLLSLSKKGIIENISENIPKTSNTVYRMKLTSGRFIDCTANHLILTTDGYKKLKDITADDSVACAINYGNNDGEYIEEARFIGWMIGNGSMYGYHAPSFITNDKIIADDFVSFVENKFGFKPKDHPHYRSKVYQYDITKNSVRTPEGNPATFWFKENKLWGNKAQTKIIPEWFLEKANTQSICELLAGLWETDGSIQIGNRETISYSTTSYILAQQILYLLAKIGIFANINDGYVSKKATCPCYKIIIDSSYFKKVFVNKIKLGGIKGEKIKRLIFTEKQSHFINKIGVKTAQEISALYKSIPHRKFRLNIDNGRRTTITHLDKALKDAKRLNSDILDKYHWLVSDSIIWNKVISISEIGVVDIFDRSVPKTNNFIVNGIVVHNSGAIEQDADMVMFIYRPEYYGISDGGPDGSMAPDTAEIIIAKHRNGSLGSVFLKFIDRLAKFVDPDSNSNSSHSSDTTPTENYNPLNGLTPSNDFTINKPTTPPQGFYMDKDKDDEPF